MENGRDVKKRNVQQLRHTERISGLRAAHRPPQVGSMKMMYPIGTFSRGIVNRVALVPDRMPRKRIQQIQKWQIAILRRLSLERYVPTQCSRSGGTEGLRNEFRSTSRMDSHCKHHFEHQVHRVQTFPQHRSLNMGACWGDSRVTYLSRGNLII